jgi:hypothetical protein
MTMATIIQYLSSTWRPYALFAFLCILVYGHTVLFSEYTYYDDHYLIVQSHPFIDEISDIVEAFFDDVGHAHQGGNLYRPILTISFIIDAQLSGTSTVAFRVTNILLHLLSVCLLFRLLTSVTGKKLSSLAASLVFALHPALTQAVAWIPGRNDSLLAVFILGAFLTLLKFTETSAWRWYLLHLLMFFLALFTKESGIAFVVVGLAYLILIRRDGLQWRTVVPLMAGWGMIVVNWQVLRWITTIYQVQDWGHFVAKIARNSWAAIPYLGKLFWPFDLAFAPLAEDLPIVPGAVGVIALALSIGLSERRNWPLFVFGLGWFFLFLLPTFYMHEVATATLKFYEHRIYVPFIGLLMALLALTWPERFRPTQLAGVALLAVLLVFLGYRSFAHSFHYYDSLTLREYAARSSPNDKRLHNAITRLHLPPLVQEEILKLLEPIDARRAAQLQATRDELDLIRQSLVAARERTPGRTDILHSLASVHFAQGWLLTGERILLEVAAAEPDNAEVFYNLGVLYYEGHKVAKAGNAWNVALDIDSTMADAHQNLAYLYLTWNRHEEAWNHCQKAIRFGAQVSRDLVEAIETKVASHRRQVVVE